MTIGPFDKTGRSQITQLINKSNQFNLTSRRYTEADVEQLGSDPDVLTFQVRLADIFGDNGMISVVILRKCDDVWTIDTWLMSCRVLGRGVEQALLNEIVTDVLNAGGKRIVGIYRPTDRNEMVREHYRKLGFDQINVDDDSSTSWLLDLSTYQAQQVPIQIIRISKPSLSLQEIMRA